MPEGRRQAALLRGMEGLLDLGFEQRVLPFDRQAAAVCGRIAVTSRRSGRNVGVADLQIAAIAIARGADAVATRNVADFQGLGLTVINPRDAI